MDDEKEAFDIVLMVHPNAVPYLPVECERIAEDFTANHVGKGSCLYHPYMGISYRDPTFDMYMNSQECLVGPGTEFLGGYKVLLRFMSLISALPYRGQTWPTWPLMACYFHCPHHQHGQGRHGHLPHPGASWVLARGSFAEQPVSDQLQPSKVFFKLSPAAVFFHLFFQHQVCLEEDCL